MRKTILIFGCLSMTCLILLQIHELYFLRKPVSRDLMLSVSALLFVIVGFYLRKLFQHSPEGSPKNSLAVNQEHLQKTGLSKREYEILALIAQGHSNAEIGRKLYISENTVKSHVSSLFSKLAAKRRTQAVQIARDLNLID